ncbi:hypothetical protein [Enterobacter hormaechei]|uniref:hypothetical protein n=1 Tax=Enterobacter hormaechei TaxID=158836 RepID=UPI002074E2EC|nr:hypothetical protein [Enterobacter hormaechei]
MSNIDKRALTAESARESGNILLIVAARMARRELFTPLNYVSELPQKVVSMRVFREALERSEETLQREVCKIVDGHDRLQKKLKEAEAKLEAAEKRVVELEARMVKLPERYEVDMCPTPSPDGEWYSREDILAALVSAGVSYAAGNGKGE